MTQHKEIPVVKARLVNIDELLEQREILHPDQFPVKVNGKPAVADRCLVNDDSLEQRIVRSAAGR